MDDKLNALVEALADLFWEHMEDRVREEARAIAVDVVADTDFEATTEVRAR